MKINYAVIGLDNSNSAPIITNLSGLANHSLVGTTEDPNKLLDIIIAGSPNLIFINVDDYSSADYKNLRNTINDLYRSPAQKPFLVAIASSKKQAYNCIKYNFFYYLRGQISKLELQKLNYKIQAVGPSNESIPEKLCLKTYSDYRFIDIKDILFLKADNNTTEFFLKDKSKIIAFKTLKHFESILPKSFWRIHQSFVINQDYISRIHLGKSECHLKPLKMRLPFSKSYRKVMTQLAVNLSSNALN